MKAYSQDLRDRVMSAYCEGSFTKKEICKLFKICADTLNDWINRLHTTGDYSSKQGLDCGRPQRFTDKDSILKFIYKNPDANGIEIRDSVAPDLPINTFYDTLKRMGITYKKRA
jgi:transposase